MRLSLPFARRRPVTITFRRLALGLILTRLAVLILRVSLLAGRADTSDFRYFLDLARMTDAGYYPHIHFWVEYPPVFPWIIVGAYRLSVALLSGVAVEVFFYALLGLFLIGCEVVSFLLIYRLAAYLDRAIALRSALLYILLFVPCYLWTGWFDHLPTCLFLLALYLLLRGRPGWSGALTALGIVSKLFPAVLVPVALCALRGRRRQITYALAAALVFALFTVPFLLANPPMLWASVRTAFNRPSWETVWALIDHYYSYGVVAPLAQHLDPRSADWVVHGSRLPYAAITLVFAALFALFYLRFYATARPRQVVAAAAFSVTLLMLYSRGYSPQYLTWLAPLLVILYPDRRGALSLGLLMLLNLVELLPFISFFPHQTWMLVFTVSARTLILVLLAAAFLAQALSSDRLPLSFLENLAWPGSRRRVRAKASHGG